MTTNLVNRSDAPKKNGIENGMSLFLFFFFWLFAEEHGEGQTMSIM